MIRVGKVGTAPGTTTLTIGATSGLGNLPASAFATGRPPHPIQNPAEPVVDMDGRTLLGTPPLGLILPTDFQQSCYLNYLPVNAGWVVGTLGATEEELPELSTEEAAAAKAQYEARAARAEAISKEEQIRTARSTRLWAAIGGVVAVGTLVLAIYEVRK